jgi:hypothetical protein
MLRKGEKYHFRTKILTPGAFLLAVFLKKYLLDGDCCTGGERETRFLGAVEREVAGKIELGAIRGQFYICLYLLIFSPNYGHSYLL